MLFAHDTELALDAAVALVNTAASADELLPDPAALDAFLDTHGWSGRREGTEEELRAVRALRPRLRRIWDADEDEIVTIVNRLLRDARALPQLVRHDDHPYHLHATGLDAPLAQRMAVEAAMAFVDVVRAGELARLRLCAYPGCGNVLVDLSRNRSKRFCDTTCGNRAAVVAYRQRRTGQG